VPGQDDPTGTPGGSGPGTAWPTLSGPQQTLAVQQTSVAGMLTQMVTPGTTECYDCWATNACPSGWGRVCFMGDIQLPVGCQVASECEAPPPGSRPCVPGWATVGTPLGERTFDRCEGAEWAMNLWVEAYIPPHIVQIDPFPRWLVGMGAPLPEPYQSGEPGTLTLQDYPVYSTGGYCSPTFNINGYTGCWSEEANNPSPPRTGAGGEPAPQEGDVIAYRLGVRWRRIDVAPGSEDPTRAPAICWDWDEREWNIGKDYGYGPISGMSCGKSVSHIYETSSWGKPKNGPNFIPAQDACSTWSPVCQGDSPASSIERGCHCCEQIPTSMAHWYGLPAEYMFDPDLGPWQNPAYQVRVPTYWAAEWALQWKQWERVPGCMEDTCTCQSCPEGETCSGKCDCRAGRPAGYCSGEREYCDCEDKYEWVDHFDGWHVIDVSAYRPGPWYETSYSVYSGGEYPGCAFEYGAGTGTAVPVPVIEVQSVIRDACVLDGTCP
jgi:hypothetical protein